MLKQDGKTTLDVAQNSIIVRKLSIYERLKLLREAEQRVDLQNMARCLNIKQLAVHSLDTA